MINVLLVDDEPMVRRRLRGIIDWEQMGFSLVGEASDGEEGLEKIRALNPDLIITDIRMPVISGLELIRRAKEEHPHIQALILSGYSDFEYAHEAMEYEVKHYLLKPIEKDNLVSVLERVREEIRSKKALHHQIQESNRVLQQRWAAELLHQREIDPSIIERGEELNIDVRSHYFGVFTIEMDDLDELLMEDRVEEIAQRKGQLLRVIEEIGERYGKVFIIEESVGRLVMLCILQKGAEQRLKELAEILQEAVRGVKGQTVTIGFSGDSVEIEDIHQAYVDAKDAVEHKFLVGKDRVIAYGDLMKDLGENPWRLMTNWDYHTIVDAIENYDESMLTREIDKFFNILWEAHTKPVIAYGLVMDILMDIGRLVKKMEGDWSEVSRSHTNLAKELEGKETLEEIKIWLLDICLEVKRYMNRLRENRPRKVSEEVVDYINQHYGEDISLKSIAGIVYMNPVYLGQVFKNDLGISFNEYLANKRVEEACRLLLNSSLNVYEVAEKVGYKTPGNFYKVFKKVMGLSPADYRLQEKERV